MLHALENRMIRAWKRIGEKRPDLAFAELDRALSAAARVEDQGLTWIGHILSFQAQCAHDLGDYGRAFGLARRSVAIHCRHRPDPGFPQAFVMSLQLEWCLALLVEKMESAFEGRAALDGYLLAAMGHAVLGRRSLEDHAYDCAARYARRRYGAHEYAAWILDHRARGLYLRGDVDAALAAYRAELGALRALPGDGPQEAAAQVAGIIAAIEADVADGFDGNTPPDPFCEASLAVLRRATGNPLGALPELDINHISLNEPLAAAWARALKKGG